MTQKTYQPYTKIKMEENIEMPTWFHEMSFLGHQTIGSPG